MKAFLCGVSKYKSESANDLPGCEVDVNNISHAIVEGLKLDQSEIKVLGGNQEYVSKGEFIQSLMGFSVSLSEDDTAIFYFSGHGSNNSYGKHEILLSDDSIETEQIIELLENSLSKNNIVILDCCYAGNVKFEIKIASIMNNLSDIVERGTEVFCACNNDEKSYEYEGKGGFFTYVFSKTLETFVGNEKKGLTIREFTNYVRRFFEIGLKDVPYKQTFVQIGNSIGDFYLIEPQPEKYHPVNVLIETNDFIIEEVEDKHSGRNKRYSIIVRLKFPSSNEQIKRISDEVVSLSKNFEVYKNEQQHKRLSEEGVSHVFCYFGYTQVDILNSNFYCRSVWVDENQNKSHWIKPGENSELIEDTLLIYNASYLALKIFIEKNTGRDTETFEIAKAIEIDAINIGQKIVKKYNEYLNKKIVEYELMEYVDYYSSEIERLRDESLNLDYTTEKLKRWINKVIGLVGTLFDFVLFYGSEYSQIRDKENRKQCMNSSIELFYKDIDSIAEIEATLTDFF